MTDLGVSRPRDTLALARQVALTAAVTVVLNHVGGSLLAEVLRGLLGPRSEGVEGPTTSSDVVSWAIAAVVVVGLVLVNVLWQRLVTGWSVWVSVLALGAAASPVLLLPDVLGG